MKKDKNFYAILMAGGVGSRFWPLSTADFPKQFHDMLGTGETLLQKTFSRLQKIVPTENILVLTNQKYNDLVLQQLNISQNQVILEPAMRNTAPCILYASLKIHKQNPKAQIVVAPSDHWIKDENSFAEHLKQSFEFCATSDALMTLGIEPAFPNTGYGYIEFDKKDQNPIKKVKQFREKPNLKTAQKFLDSGNFLWNAGIFIWSVQSVLDSFKKHQPRLFELFEKGNAFYNTENEATFIEENYPKSENISIDYAILEKADNVYVLPSVFDWNDLGTWGSLYEKLPKNENKNAIVNAKVISEKSKNNIIRTEGKKLVVLKGLSNYIVVETDDVLMIYPKKEEQNIKEIVQKNGL